MFFDDGALYNGKVIDLREKMAGVVEGMKKCPNFEKIIAVKRFDRPFDTSHMPVVERLEQFIGDQPKRDPPSIVRVGFQDPAMIFYTSGTTGIPKAIVHGTGNLLVCIKRDVVLHRNHQPTDLNMQYTTTGWIMYLHSIGHMINGAPSVLYDGSPFVPDLTVLLRLVEEHKVNHLGVSPRWMAELMKNRIVPRDVADLSSLKLVESTGMVLPDQMFEWFYDVAFPKTTQLGNHSGGTDIVSNSIKCIAESFQLSRLRHEHADCSDRLAALAWRTPYRLCTLEAAWVARWASP